MISLTGKILNTLISVFVNPGPWYLPTPQFPNWPSPGKVNAAGFNHSPVLGLSEAPALAFPTQSGREI